MAGRYGDYRLQQSSGILPERWLALAALGSDLEFPARTHAAWREPGPLGLRLTNMVFFNTRNDIDALVFRGRLMALAIALVFVAAVYAWTAYVLGVTAGLLAA